MKNETKDIFIYGAGGFAREVLWLIRRINEAGGNWNVLGFIDDRYPEKTMVGDFKICGGRSFLTAYEKKAAVVIAIGDAAAREVIYGEIKKNNKLYFPTLMAPTVRIGNNIKLGTGCIICEDCILTSDIEIGDFVLINLACTIGHDARLESFVTLFPSVSVSGGVIIGSFSQIGVGARIIEYVKIGEKTIMGAGAVAVKNIAGNCTAVGIPAKIIKINGVTIC